MRTWAAQTGLPEDAREDLLLSLGEALANAVEHAYAYTADGGRVERCEYLVRRAPDGSVHVRVTDGGVWRPPPEDKGHRGRGLELIAALAEDVEVGPLPDGGSGTVVSFRLRPMSRVGDAGGGPAPAEGLALPAVGPPGGGAWAGDGARPA